MEDVGLFYSHLVHLINIRYFCHKLVYFVVNWYIISRFLVCCTKKNLATLLRNGHIALRVSVAFLKRVSYFANRWKRQL
jgi:hypothetical protein